MWKEAVLSYHTPTATPRPNPGPWVLWTHPFQPLSGMPCGIPPPPHKGSKLLRRACTPITLAHPFSTPVRFCSLELRPPISHPTLLATLLEWYLYCPLPGSAASAPDALRPREGRLRPGTRLHPGRPPRPRPLREGTVSARDALLCGECTPRVRLRPL